MPPKRERNLVKVNVDDYVLKCEWMTCQAAFTKIDDLISHVTIHLQEFMDQQSPGEAESPEDYTCQWRECATDVEGGTSGYLRHVYFHVFHVKIKCIGELLIRKTQMQGCQLDVTSRNLIPELPERLQCGWNLCEGCYENADIFYRHVENHADCFPDGNNIPKGCTCEWHGCGLNVKNKYKLREHLRSHTQEKVAACPTCGGLFSSRTKFFDHLRRQEGGTAGKRYQCSHCQKLFSTVRLLRDHMRHHVNQYKCPYCDMTSPSPSCLRLHLKYRHSSDKPYKCESCTYSCKSMSDLRKHAEIHNVDAPYHCQVDGCQYRSRGYQSLANHFKRVHQDVNVSNYMCHVCNAMFTRGAILTKHLKKTHKFNWPSGHSRFRYKLHPDGLWRLQTVRYESIELNTEAGEDGPQDNHDNRVAMATNETGQATSADASQMSDETVQLNRSNEENMDCNIQSMEGEGEGQGQNFKNSTDSFSEYHKGLVAAAEEEEEEDDITEITLTTDSEGRVVITTDKLNNVSEPVTITMQTDSNFEENMYNLQMLGEVALKDPKI